MTLPVWPAEPELDEPAPTPPFLVEVAFKGNRRAFYRCDFDAPPPMGAAVIVEVERGEDLGRVHATGARAAQRSAGVPHGVGDAMPEARILRLATPAEVTRERALRTEDEQARRAAAEKVREAKLDLKLSDAEWQFDRKKLTFYFTAEKRIDFRALVRDLAAQFRARIELKQYGVRDEAKRLSGIGRCGREYCSASWLPELRPVNLGVAKEQKLSLNPSQISGACGRLMCCLRYEHDFYAAARKRFPKEGKIIVTDRGEEKVVSVDIFRDRVTLRSVEGEVRIAELAEITGAPAAAITPRDESPEPESADTASESSAEARSDARSTARPANRSDTRSAPPRRGGPREEKRDDRRNESRSDDRGDARKESRGDARAESRGDTRSDDRTDARKESRGDNRGDASAASRPDARPQQRAERRPDDRRANPRPPRPSDIVPPAAATAPSLDDTEADDDGADDAEGADDAPNTGAPTNADGSPAPRRRRRGRRGGRRGRGPGGGGAAGTGPSSTPS